MGAGPRSDIHDMIRRKHGVFVMLHHQQRVAHIFEILQGGDQLVIVPLVQTDTGFVQNIAHSHQTGTDLCRQTDPLCLTAGERSCSP